MKASIIVTFRIREAEFASLWDLTVKSINGILNTVKNFKYELIIIDNGSHSPEYSMQLKGSSVLWNEMYPNVEGSRILRFDEHKRLSEAWNEGINQADGEYIVLANNDIVYHQEGWLDRMLDTFGDTIGIVGIQHMSWYKFAFVEGSLFAFPAAFRDEFNIKDDEDDIRKYVLFDERFELSCEDVDFNKRVQDAGYSVMQVNHPPLQPTYLQHIGHQTINSLAHHTDIVRITHQARIALCEKWGITPEIND